MCPKTGWCSLLSLRCSYKISPVEWTYTHTHRECSKHTLSTTQLYYDYFTAAAYKVPRAGGARRRSAGQHIASSHLQQATCLQACLPACLAAAAVSSSSSSSTIKIPCGVPSTARRPARPVPLGNHLSHRLHHTIIRIVVVSDGHTSTLSNNSILSPVLSLSLFDWFSNLHSGPSLAISLLGPTLKHAHGLGMLQPRALGIFHLESQPRSLIIASKQIFSCQLAFHGGARATPRCSAMVKCWIVSRSVSILQAGMYYHLLVAVANDGHLSSACWEISAREH